jgi:hypothetical protein
MMNEGSTFLGKIFIMKRYDRNIIRSLPNTLFVFGDNLARIGYGGQAAEARGERNSVGIVTKMSPQQYLTDEDFNTVKEPIVEAFVRLAEHLRNGQDIVWPRDGVGTGLARLPETAPRIFEAIEDCKQALFFMADAIILEQ